jgi:hypothetical protein
MLWQFQLSCLRYRDGDHARRAVADALEALEGHLLAHLDYEERNVAATARRLRDFPPLERASR